jgi:hypothetical protein
MVWTKEAENVKLRQWTKASVRMASQVRDAPGSAWRNSDVALRVRVPIEVFERSPKLTVSVFRHWEPNITRNNAQQRVLVQIDKGGVVGKHESLEQATQRVQCSLEHSGQTLAVVIPLVPASFKLPPSGVLLDEWRGQARSACVYFAVIADATVPRTSAALATLPAGSASFCVEQYPKRGKRGQQEEEDEEEQQHQQQQQQQQQQQRTPQRSPSEQQHPRVVVHPIPSNLGYGLVSATAPAHEGMAAMVRLPATSASAASASAASSTSAASSSSASFSTFTSAASSSSASFSTFTSTSSSLVRMAGGGGNSEAPAATQQSPIPSGAGGGSDSQKRDVPVPPRKRASRAPAPSHSADAAQHPAQLTQEQLYHFQQQQQQQQQLLQQQLFHHQQNPLQLWRGHGGHEATLVYPAQPPQPMHYVIGPPPQFSARGVSRHIPPNNPAAPRPPQPSMYVVYSPRQHMPHMPQEHGFFHPPWRM